ncbi:alpha/beta fold hydrolase [Gemella sanguinis]|uniref:alpha/beta fold hydrolase n=1 Tax=Gemella sanguinis TaxID=84135 RepID=UPI0026E925EE|nr:alpha/beta hydrolase [Gemella sanguinis]
MNQKTKTFFIGGLGSNYYHAKDFIEELDEKVSFLNLYIENFKNKQDLISWFKNEIKDLEEVYLIGHSLGGDLARYLALQFSQVTKLVLLDGGYLNLDEIMTLDDELTDTKDYFSQQVFTDIEEVIASEKSQSSYWSKNLEEAVRNSYRYNSKTKEFELDLDLEKVLNLLRLRRVIKPYETNLDSKDVLFIAPVYKEEPEWRKEALSQLPSNFDIAMLENSGHELYTQKPREIAKIINDWINKK